MRNLLITIAIGVIVGIIDISPMVKMKIDKYAIFSAFVFYLITPFIIFNTTLFDMIWWLKGSVITLILALPIVILVAKSDKKSIPIMLSMSIILGAIIGILGHFLIK